MNFSRKVFSLLLLTVSAAGSVLAQEDAGQEPVARACFHKVCFPAMAEMGGLKLPLRSAGNKDWWVFSLYDAGLYTSREVSKEDILSDIPRILVLRYRRSIPKEKIVEAAGYKLEKTPGIDLEAIRDRVSYLHSLYRSVKKGDEYALAYEPGRGIQLYFNGEKQGNLIPGSDFAKAYFGIWLSKHVVCRKLRWELLDLR